MASFVLPQAEKKKKGNKSYFFFSFTQNSASMFLFSTSGQGPSFANKNYKYIRGLSRFYEAKFRLMNHGKQCSSGLKFQGIVYDKDVIQKSIPMESKHCKTDQLFVSCWTSALHYLYPGNRCVTEWAESSLSERWGLNRVVSILMCPHSKMARSSLELDSFQWKLGFQFGGSFDNIAGQLLIWYPTAEKF